MATNEIYKDADSVPYPVEEGVASGDPVIFESGLFGVAEVDAKDDEAGTGFVATIRTKGIWAFDMGAGAIAAGAPIYTSTAGTSGYGVVATLTTDPDDGAGTDHVQVGTVYRGKPAAAGTIYVRIGA